MLFPSSVVTTPVFWWLDFYLRQLSAPCSQLLLTSPCQSGCQGFRKTIKARRNQFLESFLKFPFNIQYQHFKLNSIKLSKLDLLPWNAFSCFYISCQALMTCCQWVLKYYRVRALCHYSICLLYFVLADCRDDDSVRQRRTQDLDTHHKTHVHSMMIY